MHAEADERAVALSVRAPVEQQDAKAVREEDARFGKQLGPVTPCPWPSTIPAPFFDGSHQPRRVSPSDVVNETSVAPSGAASVTGSFAGCSTPFVRSPPRIKIASTAATTSPTAQRFTS